MYLFILYGILPAEVIALTQEKKKGIIENEVGIGSFGTYLEEPIANAKRLLIVGEKMLILRRKAGMSQKDVCDIIGVAPQTYSGYEKGKHEPTIETLVRLAHLYNVSVDFIVGKNDFGGEIDAEEYYESVEDNESFKDLQIQMMEIKEDLDRIKKQMNKQK